MTTVTAVVVVVMLGLFCLRPCYKLYWQRCYFIPGEVEKSSAGLPEPEEAALQTCRMQPELLVRSWSRCCAGLEAGMQRG